MKDRIIEIIVINSFLIDFFLFTIRCVHLGAFANQVSFGRKLTAPVYPDPNATLNVKDCVLSRIVRIE